MDDKISFAEFKKRLEAGTMSLEDLGQYLTLDDTARVPRLTFKEDALTDTPPETYNVDEEVYRKHRELEEKEDEEEDKKEKERMGVLRKKRILAEGDSWHLHAHFVGYPVAIGTRIRWNPRHNLKNIAMWGHTLEQILRQEDQWLPEIGTYEADYFLLCGGGNDLQEGIKDYLDRWDGTRPVDKYLNDAGKDALQRIEEGLRHIITRVSTTYGSSIPIVVHGYDYPRPLVGGGQYIGTPMHEMGFPWNKMSDVLNPIIDKLNTHVENATKSVSEAHFVSLLGVATDPWFDDMHPNSEGFAACADEIERQLGRLSLTT